MQQKSHLKPLTPSSKKKQTNMDQIKLLIQTNYFVTMLMQGIRSNQKKRT